MLVFLRAGEGSSALCSNWTRVRLDHETNFSKQRSQVDVRLIDSQVFIMRIVNEPYLDVSGHFVTFSDMTMWMCILYI